MKTYTVSDWSHRYENNRTRELKRMEWVPVPNKHDGDGYTLLVDRPDGAAMLGAWLAILQVASKCDPRGTLLRDSATPHDAASIARIARLPESTIQTALDLLENECKWLISNNPAPSCGNPAPSPDKVTMERNGTERNGTERNGTEGNGTEGNGITHTLAQIPSFDEVKAAASVSGITEASAKAFYDHHEGNQLWVNQHGKAINWRHKLTAWAQNDRQPKQNLKTYGNNRQPNSDRNAGTYNAAPLSDAAKAKIR